MDSTALWLKDELKKHSSGIIAIELLDTAIIKNLIMVSNDTDLALRV